MLLIYQFLVCKERVFLFHLSSPQRFLKSLKFVTPCWKLCCNVTLYQISVSDSPNEMKVLFIATTSLFSNQPKALALYKRNYSNYNQLPLCGDWNFLDKQKQIIVFALFRLRSYNELAMLISVRLRGRS